MTPKIIRRDLPATNREEKKVHMKVNCTNTHPEGQGTPRTKLHCGVKVSVTGHRQKMETTRSIQRDVWQRSGFGTERLCVKTGTDEPLPLLAGVWEQEQLPRFAKKKTPKDSIPTLSQEYVFS